MEERCPDCVRLAFDPDDMPVDAAICLSRGDRECRAVAAAYRRGIVDALRWAANTPSDYTKVCQVAAGRIERGGWIPWIPDEKHG